MNRETIVDNINRRINILEQLNVNNIRYDIERNKLILDVLKFAEVDNSIKKILYQYECKDDFSVELVETIIACLNSYNSEKGDFLGYFYIAFKKKLEKARGERVAAEMYRGAKSSYAIVNAVKLIKRRADAEGRTITLGEIKELAATLKVSLDAVLNHIYSVGYIEDILEQPAGGLSGEDIVFENENYDELLRTIESLYNRKQLRQKNLLAKLLTVKLLPVISENEQLLSMAMQMQFFDDWVYNEFKENNRLFSAREICEYIGVSHEAHASRAFKLFREELEKER